MLSSSSFKTKALLARASTVLSGGRKSPSRGRAPQQAFIKKISTRRTRRGIFSLISYIARTREEDRQSGEYGSVQLFEGAEQPASEKTLRTVVDEDWELLPEAENLSPLARRLVLEGKPHLAEQLPDVERLQQVQAIHITWSMRKLPDEDVDLESFTGAVSSAITACQFDELIGQRVIWGVHDDEPDRIHAHLIVHPQVHADQRIRFDKEGLFGHAMRQCFMDSLRGYGFDVAAECREDRADVRADILAGKEELHPGKPMARRKQETDPARRTPMWFIRHGLDRERRRITTANRYDQAARDVGEPLVQFLRDAGQRIPDMNEPGVDGALRLAAEAVDLRLSQEAARQDGQNEVGLRLRDELKALLLAFEKDRRLREKELRQQPGMVSRALRRVMTSRASVPTQHQEVLDLVRDSFVDPEAAVRSWAEMAGEGAYRNKKGGVSWPNKAFANWYMCKHPELFGDVTASAARHNKSSRLASALRRAEVAPVAQDISFIRNFDDQAEASARNMAEVLTRKRAQDRDKALVLKSLSWLADQVESHLNLHVRADQIREIALRAATVAAGAVTSRTAHRDIPGVVRAVSPPRFDPGGRG